MNSTRDRRFNVADDFTLVLEDVYGKVTIGIGENNVVVVSMKGSEKVLDRIKVEELGSAQITIRGEEGGITGTTVVSGRGSVVIGGSVRGGTIITGRGGVVIVNGQVISGSSDGVTVIQGDEMPEITIELPSGTNLKSYNTEDLMVHGLGGRCDLTLSGQNKAWVSGVRSPKIKCSGQSHCQAIAIQGDVRAQTSGQSSITVSGAVANVSAESSGQSHVNIQADCDDFEGETSGQSRISLTGRAMGRIRKHSSGQSSISV